MAALPPEDATPEPTFPCKVCKRKFVKASLEKHEHACLKLQNPRESFDSGSQRAKNSDIQLESVRKREEEFKKVHGHFARPNTSWKERHSEHLERIKSAKQCKSALQSGAPLPGPPKTAPGGGRPKTSPAPQKSGSVPKKGPAPKK